MRGNIRSESHRSHDLENSSFSSIAHIFPLSSRSLPLAVGFLDFCPVSAIHMTSYSTCNSRSRQYHSLLTRIISWKRFVCSEVRKQGRKFLKTSKNLTYFTIFLLFHLRWIGDLNTLGLRITRLYSSTKTSRSMDIWGLQFIQN